MKFRHIIYLSLVLLIMGCDKMGLPVHKENGSGSETLTVRVGSANLDTKSAKDGDIMNNLRIWFVKNGETTVKYYSGVINPNASTKEVIFNDVERGDYTMYVLANSTENSAYEQNSTIDEDFKKVTLPELVGNKPPFSDGDGMPMSLIKEVQVTAGNNSISAELVRVCGKIRVTLHNKVLDKKVYLNSFKFTQRNPSNGYLFFNDHAVPAGTTYGDFTSLNATNGSETIAINAGADAVIFDQYLYESGSIDLGLSLAGALYPSTFSNTPNYGSTSIQEWQFAGSATNTTIEPGKWYIIANADNSRYFLNDSGSGLAASHGENNDAEFLAAMNADESKYLKYLWTFTSSTSPTSIKNYGTDGTNGRYVNISGKNTIAMNQTPVSIYTDVYDNSWRRFKTSENYYLRYDNSLELKNNQTHQKNRGWYLREIKKVTISGEAKFNDSGAKNFSHTEEKLKYIDDYGAPITIDEICRNQILDVHLNVYHRESEGKLYFEVVSWKQPQNGTDKGTTFD